MRKRQHGLEKEWNKRQTDRQTKKLKAAGKKQRWSGRRMELVGKKHERMKKNQMDGDEELSKQGVRGKTDRQTKRKRKKRAIGNVVWSRNGVSGGKAK